MARSKLNFIIYLVLSCLSLTATNLYAFNHGWFLLEVSESHLGLGVSWAVIFVPALLFLPLGLKGWEKFGKQGFVVFMEAAKLILSIAGVLLLSYWPSQWNIYIYSILIGATFSQFYPVAYVMIKSVTAKHNERLYSNISEIALQASVILSGVLSAILYPMIGFLNLMWVTIGLYAVTLLLGLFLKLEEDTDVHPGAQPSILQQYFVATDLAQAKKLATKTNDFIYGLFHQLPQNAVLLINVPIIVYIKDALEGGAREFGIFEAVFSAAALLTSFALSRFVGWSKGLDKAFSIAAFLGIFAIAFLGHISYWLFLALVAVFAIAAVASKIAARGKVIEKLSAETAAKLSTVYQFYSFAFIIVAYFIVGVLCDTFGAVAGLYFVGALFVLYTAISSLTADRTQA